MAYFAGSGRLLAEMSQLASLSESARRIALERFRVLQPHLEQKRFLTQVARDAGIPILRVILGRFCLSLGPADGHREIPCLKWGTCRDTAFINSSNETNRGPALYSGPSSTG